MSTLQLSLNDEDPWIIEKKMFDLLSDYLQPSSTKSSEAIARALDDLFPTNRSEEDQPPDEPIEEPGSFLWHMWPLFHRVAQQIPHSNSAQDRLVELVRTLRDLPAKTPTVYLEGWSDNTYKLWEDLPLLNQTLVDEDNQIPRDSSDEELRRERNFNAYIARLTRDVSVDIKWFGVRVLAGALEGQWLRRHAHAHPPQAQTDFIPGAGLDRSVALAADWISYGGRVLFDRDEEVPGGEGGPLWKGKACLCPERWQLWKQRFGEIADNESIAEQTRQLARGAKQTMEEIEEGRKKAQ